MYFGYNTNGFAHHRLEDTLTILAELGYQGVAITLDHHVLNPFTGEGHNQIAPVRKLLRKLKLRCVIETGARFLLDPRRKHKPTLLRAFDADWRRRLAFLGSAIDIAAELGAEAVSFWSGTPDEPALDGALMSTLVSGCMCVSALAQKRQVRLAFEPEPGMFIDTMARFEELYQRVNYPNFGLTLDMGHLHCQGEGPIADAIHRWRDRLWNVHIEDMCRGVHDHRMFGEGEMDFPPILRALDEIGYTGGVFVELSRHSHEAVDTARKALEFLRNSRAKNSSTDCTDSTD